MSITICVLLTLIAPGCREILAAVTPAAGTGSGNSAEIPRKARQHANRPLAADPAADRPTAGEWGDQGDGTYANPIMPGDFSDLDAIRVGSDYYAIASAMQYSPGIAVLHSNDLVNWRIIGHVVADVTSISPEMNWDKMNRAGRGIWAGSIRYHDGKFRVYFGTPDEGYFVSTATTAAGPWSPVKLVMQAAGWDDPCPFWDDDGQGYLVGTHFSKDAATGTTYNIHLFKLSVDGEHVLQESDRILHHSTGSEANKLYKINGLYYHLYSEVANEGRVVMMRRATQLSGPWETKQLIHVNARVDKEPNQGGLVQLPSGAWYFVTHQGSGDWEGRAGVLLPVTWIDGWPILGKVGSDGIGNMIWRGRKPILASDVRGSDIQGADLRGSALTSLVASDDFSGSALKSEWEWNYQPRADKWSLKERGSLRLYAFRPLRAADFKTTGNVLTQRAMRTKKNEVTVEVDLAGMADGQEAGLAHFAKTFCTLGVTQSGPIRRLTFNNNGKRTITSVLQQNKLWLRSTWDFNGRSHFAYSRDGIKFTPMGESYQLTWANYRGDRIGLFTSNKAAERGYVDFKDFRYELRR